MKAFYLCHDPIGIMPEGMVAFVFSPDSPRFFAALSQLDPQKSMPEMDYEGCNIIFRYYTVDKVMQFYTLIVTGNGNFDKAALPLLRDALKDAMTWYCTCLAQEEKKRTGKNGGWDLLLPFNDGANDVQLLKFEASDTYLLSYGDGIISLGSFEEAQAYMKDVLGYDASVVSDVMVNTG